MTVSPAQYGTPFAVRRRFCPCGLGYRLLKKPLYIAERNGHVLHVYPRGQLICDRCLKNKIAELFGDDVVAASA